MADERDENFPNFDILSGFGVLLPHNKNSEPNSKKESLNTETEEERSSKKRRFADVENEELDSIVENAQAKKTSRQHSGQFPYSQVGFNYMNNLLAWLFTETVIS